MKCRMMLHGHDRVMELVQHLTIGVPARVAFRVQELMERLTIGFPKRVGLRV